MRAKAWSQASRFVMSPHATLRWRQGHPLVSSGQSPITLKLHKDALPFLAQLAQPISLGELTRARLPVPRSERLALLKTLVEARVVDLIENTSAGHETLWWDPFDRAGPEATLVQLIQIAHGFVRSAVEGVCVDGAGLPIPWLSRPVIDFLFQLDLRGVKVFEYGGGSSSYYWVRRGAMLTSVESDLGWFTKLSGDLSSYATLLHRPRVREYGHSILETDDSYDIILVDAAPKFRSACAGPAIERVSPTGMIILDDAPFYPEAAAELRNAGLIEVDFTGHCALEANLQTTSLFLTRDFALRRRAGASPAFPFGSPGFDWSLMESSTDD